MHRILIIEDEGPAAKRLKRLIQSLDASVEILDVIDSVEDAVSWFKMNDHPDLIFMDIQLADGHSFGIFEKIKFDSQVIFTTAYDEYAVKAFRVNGLDYLLKPIDEEQFKQAWEKFLNVTSKSVEGLEDIIAKISTKENESYRQRFLIKLGDQFKYVNADQIAYFSSEESFTFITTKDKKRLLIDDKIEALSTEVDPSKFFRINRKFIVSVDSIDKISSYFNSRLKLELNPASDDEVIVAREKVPDFKSWLNQ